MKEVVILMKEIKQIKKILSAFYYNNRYTPKL